MNPRQELEANLHNIRDINQDNVDVTFRLLIDASISKKLKSIATHHAQRVFEELLKKPIDFATWHLTIRDLNNLLTLYKENIARDSPNALTAKSTHIDSFKKAAGVPTLTSQTLDEMVHVFKKPALSYAYEVPWCTTLLIKKGVNPNQFNQRYIFEAFFKTSHKLLLTESELIAIHSIFYTAKQSIVNLSTNEIQAEAKKFIYEQDMLRKIVARISLNEDGIQLVSETILPADNENQLKASLQDESEPQIIGLLQQGAKPDLVGDIAFDFLAKWLLSLEENITQLTPIMLMNIKDHKLDLLAAIKRMDIASESDALKLIFENPNSAFAKVCLSDHTDLKKGQTKVLHEYYLERCYNQKNSSLFGSFFGSNEKTIEKTDEQAEDLQKKL